MKIFTIFACLLYTLAGLDLSASDPADTRIAPVIDSIMHVPKGEIVRRRMLADLSLAVNQAHLDSELNRLEGFEAKEACLRAEISNRWARIRYERNRLAFLRQFSYSQESIAEYKAFHNSSWTHLNAAGSKKITPTVDHIMGNPRLRISTRLDKLNYLAGMIHETEWEPKLTFLDFDDKPTKAHVEELKAIILTNWSKDIDESKRLEILSRFEEITSKDRTKKRKSRE